MWPYATNPATSPSSPMPDLTPTRLLLEAGVRENRWAGFSLAAFSVHSLFTLHGGCVSDPSDSVPWYSAGKPVTALGVLSFLTQTPQLASTSLQTTFPELASSYFGGLNLTDVLTHRTGLRFPNLPVHSPAKEIFAILAKAEPRDFSLLPRQAAYDPRGGWWLLGQWLARQTQIPWEDFLCQKILKPGGAANMFFCISLAVFLCLYGREKTRPLDLCASLFRTRKRPVRLGHRSRSALPCAHHERPWPPVTGPFPQPACL